MNIIKPGQFGKTVAADTLRMEFDFANEQLLYQKKYPDILFIGDSITHYWDLAMYFDTNKIVINRGIGGDTSEFVLKRFDADVIQLKPKLVILMIGTNDISRTHCDPWWRTTGVDKDEVLRETVHHIRECVNKCRENEIDIALCSVIPSDIAPPYDKVIRWELTEKLNDEIKKICMENNLKYVDYHQKLCQSDGKTLIYELSPDGIHPNAKCYEIMANVLKETVDLS